MNEKLRMIEEVFLEKKEINLGKQCKKEYIVYNFYDLYNENGIMMVRKMCKEHYTDSTLWHFKRSPKRTEINKSLKKVINNDIYELLLKGYELIDVEKNMGKLTKNVKITIDIDRARMALRMEGFDVDDLTEDQIFEKVLEIVDCYGLSFSNFGLI